MLPLLGIFLVLHWVQPAPLVIYLNWNRSLVVKRKKKHVRYFIWPDWLLILNQHLFARSVAIVMAMPMSCSASATRPTPLAQHGRYSQGSSLFLRHFIFMTRQFLGVSVCGCECDCGCGCSSPSAWLVADYFRFI